MENDVLNVNNKNKKTDYQLKKWVVHIVYDNFFYLHFFGRSILT
jgi:hypothetical protein